MSLYNRTPTPGDNIGTNGGGGSGVSNPFSTHGTNDTPNVGAAGAARAGVQMSPGIVNVAGVQLLMSTPIGRNSAAQGTTDPSIQFYSMMLENISERKSLLKEKSKKQAERTKKLEEVVQSGTKKLEDVVQSRTKEEEDTIQQLIDVSEAEGNVISFFGGQPSPFLGEKRKNGNDAFVAHSTNDTVNVGAAGVSTAGAQMSPGIVNAAGVQLLMSTPIGRNSAAQDTTDPSIQFYSMMFENIAERKFLLKAKSKKQAERTKKIEDVIESWNKKLEEVIQSRTKEEEDTIQQLIDVSEAEGNVISYLGGQPSPFLLSEMVIGPEAIQKVVQEGRANWDAFNKQKVAAADAAHA